MIPTTEVAKCYTLVSLCLSSGLFLCRSPVHTTPPHALGSQGPCCQLRHQKGRACVHPAGAGQGRGHPRWFPLCPVRCSGSTFLHFGVKFRSPGANLQHAYRAASSPALETFTSDLVRDLLPPTFPEWTSQELRSLLFKSYRKVARFGEKVFTFPRKADD